MPSPPTSTRGWANVPTCRQAIVASASSDPWVRLVIKVLPFTRMTCSSSRTLRRMSLPSGVHVCPSSLHGFMAAMSPTTLYQCVVKVPCGAPGGTAEMFRGR